jgi:hypothetical protein
MKTALFALAAVSMAALASPAAAADVAGAWHVAGKVGTFAFTLTCTFKPQGARLGGVCVDGSTNNPKIATGRAHPISAGSVDGDKVSWTYQSNFLLTKFNVTYAGVQAGDRMSGAFHIQGHEGTFTATRR